VTGIKLKKTAKLKNLHKSDDIKSSSFSRANLTLFAIIFAAIGGYLIYSSFAAGLSSSIEPENGTITSPASMVTDASASGGKAVKFGSSSSCSGTPGSPGGTDPWGGCWPGPNNTGYKAAPDYPGSLAIASSGSSACPTTFQSNKTYRFCKFNGADVGSMSNKLSNISFYGCLFQSTGGLNVAVFGDNITFDYSTFAPTGEPSPPISYNAGYQYGIEASGAYYSDVQQLTVTNSNFWGFANATDVDGSTQAKPQVFRNNYLHDARADGGVDHTDGIGELDGGASAYVVIDHNVIISQGNTNGIAYQYGPYDHFSVTKNYFSGFGYTVNIGGAGSQNTNLSFTDNIFGTDIQPGFGPLYGWNNSGGNFWKRNKWHIAPGTTWSAASNDGKFWTPSGISATDYGG
jgi:hypothetical protein